MAHQVTLEEAAGHLPELVREAHNGEEIVLFQDQRPVAKLVSLTDEVNATEIAALTMSGGAFDWLADEPELYDDTGGELLKERVPTLLRQWQQEYGLPVRPNGKAHTPVQELFAQWEDEDSRLTPEEADAEQRLWEDHQKGHEKVSL